MLDSFSLNRAGSPVGQANAGSISHFMDALFASVDEGIIVGDSNGKIIFANDAALRINDNFQFPESPEERVLYYSSESAEGRHMSVTDLPLRRALAEGEVKGLEVTLVTPKGQKKRLCCNARVLYNNKRERIGAVLAMRDQTRERAIEQHKEALERERSDLLQMNAELERFSAIAAHDLKSPLNSIIQFVELLRDDLGDRLKPSESEILDFISNAGERLRQLIDDLLAYARSGKNIGEMVSVDLNLVVEDVLSSLQCDLKAANAIINVGLLPVAHADKLGISQVFQNLIANAIKYRGANPPVIRIKSVDEEKCWRISVQDNGAGFREEDKPKAFDLFERFDASSKNGGTGLGLPICKRIIEAHGGTLQLESEKGLGTTMTLTLPKKK